jgi:RHH-type transcriptional regulator, proline utilization regulon repressor / proline dehydrogenase / delta 1-pyrroline-5-carboxylate dehydrogenase
LAHSSPVDVGPSFLSFRPLYFGALQQPGTPPAPRVLPGPTGESNRLTAHGRAPVLCLGPTAEAAAQQAAQVRALGGAAVEVPGALPAASLTTLTGFSGAIWWGDAETGREYAQALAARPGPILPLIDQPDHGHLWHERHICIDTTASGGNADLLATAGEA